MKEKLEIYSVPEFEGCYTVEYASKGHHDPLAFVDLLEREHGELADSADVKHLWRRNVPSPEGMFTVTCKPGRGAYRVTVIDADRTRRITQVLEAKQCSTL